MTDVNQLITDHLDIWTTATEKRSSAGCGSGGVSLYGVKKLRELILELAVRGKLLEEGGTEERGPLIPKAAKRKKTSHPDEKELDFIPLPNWTSAKFGEFFDLEYGDNLPKTKRSETGEVPVYGSNGVVGTHREACVFSPCIVVGRKGSAGALNLCLDETCWVTDVAYSCVPPAGIDLHFAMVLFSTLGLDNLGKGIKPGLSRNEAYALPIAIPPLTEQHRIVAKVDELMGLCGALERQAEDSLKAHQTLVETCLATLTNSQSPEDLTQNWTRIETHFDTLFTTEESLAELDKTVLQLGMMGLLVKQDLSISSISLLETARKTRAALVARKEAKAFKAKATSEVLDWPFTLPSSWSWLRLGEAAVLITKGSSPKWQGVSYTDDPSEVMFVTSENVGRFEMLLDNPKFVERKFNTVEPRSILKAGDYLMNIVGASIGRTAIYPGPDGANINQAVCLIRVLPGLFDPRFLIAFFNSEFCRGYMFDKQVDNARANLSMGNISQFLIPVPPIEEQVAIAEKLQLLSGLSFNLSRRLQARGVLSKSLADILTSKIH